MYAHHRSECGSASAGPIVHVDQITEHERFARNLAPRELTGTAGPEPIDFGVDGGTDNEHKLIVVDVTPEQWEEIHEGTLPLPPGWTLEGSQEISGGEVSATTTSCRGVKAKRTAQVIRKLAKFSALVIFVGFNLTFFPQFVLGYLGMPRRYHAYPPEFQVLNVLSSAGASILGAGYLIPMIYFVWSLKHAPLAGNNPWGARGLEWEIASPPPTENFAAKAIH